MSEFWFHIRINPEPWRVGPVGYARRNGKMSAYVGRDQQLDAFKNAVAEEVREQWGSLPMLAGQLRVDIYFWRNRPEYTTPNQRLHRKHEADTTNLFKATEDALQGIVFKNDKDNIITQGAIMAQGANIPGQIVIRVTQLEGDETNDLFSQFPTYIKDRVIDTMVAEISVEERDTPPDDYQDAEDVF